MSDKKTKLKTKDKKKNQPKGKEKKESDVMMSLLPNRIKHRRFFNDADYLHKLSPEDKEWYAKFIAETVDANFRHDDPIFSGEERRKLYGENNARNRDIYNKLQKQNRLAGYEAAISDDNSISPEDFIIAIMDYENERKKNPI